MKSMFRAALAFDQPLSAWDVRRVTQMEFMFAGAVRFNQPLSTWDVRSVRSTQHMFTRAFSFNQPLADWRLDSVRDARSMFEGAVRLDQPPMTFERSCCTDHLLRDAYSSAGHQAYLSTRLPSAEEWALATHGAATIVWLEMLADGPRQWLSEWVGFTIAPVCASQPPVPPRPAEWTSS